MNLLQKLILISFLVSVFLLIYSPHFSYKYPLHVDEYHHIAKAVNFIENKELNTIPNYQHQPYSPNLEPGFTIFLSLLAFAKLDLILFYKFLPAIFAALAAFILFHLMHYITKNFYLSISSIIFFASLKSNINLHGLWFFTPLTFAISLIFLFFFLFFKTLDKKSNKFLVLTILNLVLLLTIHPTSAVLVYIITFLYLLIKKDFKKNILLLVILPPLIMFLLLILLKDAQHPIINLVLDWLILEEGWGYIEIKYLLPTLYNLIPFLLAMIGLYPAIKNQKSRIFVIWFLLTIFFIFIFINYQFSLIFPYQRVLYYSLLSLVPLSALGLFFILSYIKKYKAMVPVFLILIGVFTFYNYYDLPKQSQLYHVLDDNDYNALMFLKQSPPEMILAPLPQSAAVYPVSRHYVIGMTQANILGGEKEKVKEFYDGDCETKQNILKSYPIGYVLSKNKLECNFLKEVYDEGDYIYEA